MTKSKKTYPFEFKHDLRLERDEYRADCKQKDKLLVMACKKIEELRMENADIAGYEYNEIKPEVRINLLIEELKRRENK